MAPRLVAVESGLLLSAVVSAPWQSIVVVAVLLPTVLGVAITLLPVGGAALPAVVARSPTRAMSWPPGAATALLSAGTRASR